MPRLAVIMPAYNAERYIGRAIESVLAQTEHDLNLIIVDDGSTDETPAIADAYSRRDNRIRVIHQANAGGYTARINGVRFCDSEYIGFMDADDALEPDMYQKLLLFADQNNLQVAECDSFEDPMVGRQPEVYGNRQSVEEGVVVPWLIKGNGAAFVWNKIYRREIWPQRMIETPILMFDDLAINLQVFQRVASFGRIHEGLYHYLVNDGSSVRNFKLKDIRDFREILKIRHFECRRYGALARRRDMILWGVRNTKNECVSLVRTAVRKRQFGLLVRIPQLLAILIQSSLAEIFAR